MRELPKGFVEMLGGLGLGDVATALSVSEPQVSVRINALKGPVRKIATFDAEGPVERVPWCESGVYLSERPIFALDPQWHQGRYYVQEAGSMFVSHVIRLLTMGCDRPLAVLDACAAPGGKTTAVIDSLPADSLVVANEYVPSRAAVLKENVVKWGMPSAIVTRGDTSRLARLGETFDIVVADVPCSGEGMMRKDDDAVAQWSMGLVKECAATQWDIVCDLWSTLKPGGVMVYSTCTFNRLENEETVSRIINELGGESVEIHVGSDWGITGAIDAPGLWAYRFVPGRTRGEGLFMSVIRKGDSSSGPTRNGKDRSDGGRKSGGKIPACVTDWLTAPDRYDIYICDDRINAFPRQWSRVLARLRAVTDVIHEGVHVASLKGRDYVPAHGLIMSVAFNKGAFPLVDIDKDTALRYLRGESPVMPSGVPKGVAVLAYEGVPLGAVKNLGNRSNSLYPSQWKLKI